MIFRRTALLAASALAVTVLGGAPALAVPTEPTADWRTGWCAEDEGLSVVVDFGVETSPTVPAEGFLVRCLIGGVVETTPELSRVNALRAVGLEVEADRSGYITSIEGVEEYSGDSMWWLFSGAAVPGPWDTGNHGIVADGPNLNRAFGARLVGQDWADVPRPTPQFGTAPQAPQPEPAPVVTSSTPPSVTGEARVGSLLRSSLGSWSDGAVLSREWRRNGVAIPGATSATYRLQPGDLGARISLAVTGSKAGHTSTTAVSPQTAPVQAGLLNGKRPTVRGKAKVGRTLRAAFPAWKPAGVKVRFQWLRDGKAVRGATTKTYRLRSADRGHRMSVRVTGIKPGYTTLTRTSARTVRVSR